MSPDTPTLALVAGCIAVLQAIAFTCAWALNRNAPGLRFWTLSSLLTGCSLLLVLGRQSIDSTLLTRWIPTLFTWAAVLLLNIGTTVFRGQKPALKWPLLCCIPSLAGYLWFGWATDQQWLRPIFYSAPIVLFFALTAREWFSEQRVGLRLAAYFGGVTAVLYALSFVFRAGTIATHRGAPEPFGEGTAQVLLFSITILWLLCWTYNALLLVNQWNNLQKVHLYDAQLLAQQSLAKAESQLALRERELLSERAQRQRELLLRDLHDGIGGMTANLVLLASMGQGKDESSERHELMHHIEHLAIDCNREVRLLMDVLEKGPIDWHQFLQEVHQHATHLAAGHGFSLSWKVTGTPPEQALNDAAARLSLLRCLKEAISNLARHSQARRASIRVRFFKNYFCITVRDNGIGLKNEPMVDFGGRGLPNMRRRCEELLGRVTLRCNSGTALRFIIPLPVSLHPIAKKPLFSNLANEDREFQMTR
jgi:signal transduction histidine kinase